MSDEGTITKPQYAEIFLYEDRHGNHCARINMNGQEVLIRLRRQQRASLSDEATAVMLRHAIGGLEVRE